MEKNNTFENFYIRAILDADIIAETVVPGCHILKPYGYLIWERIRTIIDKDLTKLGYQKAYFPMLIPHSLFSRQKEFYNSFSKEAIFAERAGTTKLAEKYVIRPTSEPVIIPSVKGWIRNEKDLPLKIVQWCNIIRWEVLKTPFPLIRSNEFLWHECYSFHANKKECDNATKTIYLLYRNFMVNYLAIPVFTGLKPDRRKFPAAEYTFALEAIVKNCRSVQAATSHSLGTNYSKPFDLKFNIKGKKNNPVYVSCAGLTTRLIGIIAMVHNDEKGIILPPKIAPYEIAVIGRTNIKLKNTFRCCSGKNKDYWIVHGVPIVIDGKKLTRRDTLEVIELEKDPKKQLIEILKDITSNLAKRAKEFKKSHTFEVVDYSRLCDIIGKQKGFCLSAWCGSVDCISRIKKDSNGSLRIINPINKKMSCIVCKKKGRYLGLFGQSY